MTEAELEEGRRLLEVDNEARGLLPKAQSQASLIDWFWAHRHALLARREEIAREAVREFGEACQIMAMSFERDRRRYDAVSMEAVKAIAAARGATLDEKP